MPLERWQKWGILAFFFLIAGAFSVYGLLSFTWIFPLWEARYSFLIWAALCLLYVECPWQPLRWIIAQGGFLAVTAYQGAWYLGAVGTLLPWLLWFAFRRGRKWGQTVWIAGAFGYLCVSHLPFWPHPGWAEAVGGNARWGLALLSILQLFKWIYVGAMLGPRRESIAPQLYRDYWFAPFFWLSPQHANQLLVCHLEPLQSENPEDEATERSFGLLWLLRGLLHTAAFAAILHWYSPERFIGDSLSGGGFAGWLRFGLLLFAVSYFEKSRMSYLVSGFLRWGGARIAPDFHAPWLAKDLLDYWRRFHGWVLEYLEEIFYLPFAHGLARRMDAGKAAALGIFAAFFLGSSLSHWVHYPGDGITVFGLALLFALSTLLHFGLQRARISAWITRPLTWLTVFLLYSLSYPVFGLGWDGQRLWAWIWG